MQKHIKISLFLLLIIYIFCVLLYPVSADESIFSVVGKNIDIFKLYKDLPEDKPPGIFFTIFLLSKIPFSLFLVNRVVLILLTLSAAYLTMKLSKKLFNSEQEFLYIIPVFYILFSVFYLGGLIPLSESYEILFILASFTIFFNSRDKNYDISLLIFSCILLFIAFQYKQTALFFSFVPLFILYNEKRFKELFIFISTFLLLFVILLLVLNYFGIFGDYLKNVWLFHLYRGSSFSLTTKIFTSFFVLPLVILAFPGLLVTIKKYRMPSILFLITSLIVFFVSFILIKSISFRFYFLELVPLLLLFVPYTFKSFNKMKLAFKLIILFIILVLVFWLLFIFMKVAYGNNSLNNFSDLSHISIIIKNYSCTNLFATMNYWYISGTSSPNMRYSLTGMGLDYLNTTLESLQYSLEQEDTCFVYYHPDPFYSIKPFYDPDLPKDVLSNISESFCKCNYFDLKASSFFICYNCGVSK